MKNRIKFALIISFLMLFSTSMFAQINNRQWWNSLPPAWKKIFQVQELKGKEIDPTDEQLDRIVKITYISCAGNDEVTSLNPLGQLLLLETIRCNDCKNLKSLDGIDNLKNLKEIDCSNNDNINSLTPLQGIISLERLNCSNTMVKNLVPLRGLTNLKVLDLSFTTISELTFLSNLVKLENLNVSKNASLFKLDGLEKMLNLTELNVSESQVKLLDPLANLRELKVLDISSTPVASLRALSSVTIRKSLRDLNISNTQIDGAQLDYLTNHLTLEMLRCRDNKLCPDDVEDFVSAFSKTNPNCILRIKASSDATFISNNCH